MTQSIQDFATGRLTAPQFEAAVAVFPRLSEAGVRAARTVLVDGIEQAKVAATMQIHRQQVNRWVRQIYAAHCGCPKGWEIEVVMLPPEQMANVREMQALAVKQIRESIKKDRRD